MHCKTVCQNKLIYGIYLEDTQYLIHNSPVQTKRLWQCLKVVRAKIELNDRELTRGKG